MYENLLLGDFAGEIKKWLEKLEPKIKGELDKQEFKSCSIRGSGKKAFVLKGFIADGPAIRFRTPWGQLSDGEIFYKAKDSDPWTDTTPDPGGIQFVPGSKPKLILDFTDEDGKHHHAEFTL